jgi:hypothetical protein
MSAFIAGYRVKFTTCLAQQPFKIFICCTFLGPTLFDLAFNILKTLHYRLILHYAFVLSFAASFCFLFSSSSSSYSTSSLIFASRQLQASHNGKRTVTDHLETKTQPSSYQFLEPEYSSYLVYDALWNHKNIPKFRRIIMLPSSGRLLKCYQIRALHHAKGRKLLRTERKKWKSK